MLTAEEKRILRKNLEKYEGTIGHMYLDTAGNVTTGIGHLLASSADAKKLLFHTAIGTRASPREVEAEYENIRKLPYGYAYPASSYAKHAKLRIRQTDIDALTNRHISSFESELRLLYPGFNLYPTTVRLALFDMIFNLGMTKLRARFLKFNAAIAARNWAVAAQESNRPHIQALRNRYVRELLEQAARAESHATAGAN